MIRKYALARIFHQAGQEFYGKAHEHRFCGIYGGKPLCTAGLRGCWRPICGIFAPPLRANRLGYWLGAGYANLLATCLAIIPRPGEISGLALLLSFLVAGCAPWSAVDPNSRQIKVKEDYSLEAPLGWVRRNYDVYDVFLSRDGPLLNFIAIDREKHDRELPRTKRKTSADLLPQEVAELVIAEQKAVDSRASFTVLSNQPAMLGGTPAVRVHTRWKTERGLPIERLTYAMVDQKGRLALIYEAPGLVYFPKGLADFEAMVKTLSLA